MNTLSPTAVRDAGRALTADDLNWRPDMTAEEHRRWLAIASRVLNSKRPLLLPGDPAAARAFNRDRLQAVRALEKAYQQSLETERAARKLYEELVRAQQADVEATRALRRAFPDDQPVLGQGDGNGAALRRAGPADAPDRWQDIPLSPMAEAWAATGPLLASARRAARLSQARVAREAHLSRGYLSDLEQERLGLPGVGRTGPSQGPSAMRARRLVAAVIARHVQTPEHPAPAGEVA